MATTSPLLRTGTFGTHLICCSGIYSFSGNVPADIKPGGYKSEHEGIVAFVDWFTAQDEAFRREHAVNLRDDVFALYLVS